MALITNLEGRITNLKLPKSKALMPLFEAVVNAVQSIEDNNKNNGLINIYIRRSDEKIIDFEIHDNGIGFNDENFRSFQTLDSRYKYLKGCHGIGRLLWLKTFKMVHVDSIYESNGKYEKLSFDFNIKDGDHKIQKIDGEDKKCTGSIIHLRGFLEEYRVASPKDSEIIARDLLEHLFYYFILGQAPKIIVYDGNFTHDLDEMYECLINQDIAKEDINIRGKKFSLVHGKIRGNIKDSNTYGMLAANRLVKEKSITSKMILGLPKKLVDENGDFTYICYVESEYLNVNVNVERTGFILAESGEDLFDELTMQEIERAILNCSKQFLNSYVENNIKNIKNKVDSFVETKQPKYKPILKYLTEEDYPDSSDVNESELELILHKAYQKLEKSILKETQENLKPQEKETYEEFHLRSQYLLEKITDIKQSDLSSYILRRKLVLEYLEKSLFTDEKNKYEKESVIHSLIVPMGKESDDILDNESNLWIIDERLSFHNYLASDKKISSMPIFPDNTSGKEPDVLSMKLFDNPILVNEDNSPKLGAITVVEFKRPMRNDMTEDDNPIDQVLNYVRNVRNGKIQTKQGRPISENQIIPAFCYVIADISPKMKERCENYGLRASYEGDGYFGYNEAQKAYIEVISFDKLLVAAKERNRAFFNKLGLSVK